MTHAIGGSLKKGNQAFQRCLARLSTNHPLQLENRRGSQEDRGLGGQHRDPRRGRVELQGSPAYHGRIEARLGSNGLDLLQGGAVYLGRERRGLGFELRRPFQKALDLVV
jgi:hypothetical protein